MTLHLYSHLNISQYENSLTVYVAEVLLESLMIHIHSRRDGIHMWSHSGASVGGDLLEMFAGHQDLVVKKKLGSLRNTLSDIVHVCIIGL